jgi:hypothetical protein
MKIMYDNISSDYLYPLSKKDMGHIKGYFPTNTIEKIKVIRFGCNLNTTQEGRTVQRGNFYDIRINFCLRGLKSKLLSDQNDYIILD